MKTTTPLLSHAQLLQLKRWNTPTIYNGWEQITNRNTAREGFNIEQTHDLMPHMGPMVGYAATVVIQPSNPKHRQDRPNAWSEYRRYVANVPGPKIIVVQDLDKPQVFGSFWGEVNSNIHRVLGAVGTITDGAVRDLDEMNNAGFKALARRLCVGHGFSHPARWNCEVEVFGRKVQPGDLVHADKHGFLVIPPEDQQGLWEAASFMDANECSTLIASARNAAGRTTEEILAHLDAASLAFAQTRKKRFPKSAEF